MNSHSPWRYGSFIVDSRTTFPIALPFFLHHSETETMSIPVFDPVLFAPYVVQAVRGGTEHIRIKDKDYTTTRYDLMFLNKQSTLWLDQNGKTVKSDGYIFFSGDFGNLKIEKAMDQTVFLLPVMVTLGDDLIQKTVLSSNKNISKPRSVTYIEVQLNGVRGANIDVMASNKVIISYKPVTFRIYNKPVYKTNTHRLELIDAATDTTIIGTSDYIQSKDARVIRTARKIVSSSSDTLAMAQAINEWVHKNMKEEKGLDIIRSVDILKELRGDSDEYTKLFIALARSISIPCQINMGLVYDNDVFRYHSWPSVFCRGMWYDLDPLFGQNMADATHITLIKGDFESLIEYIRLIGSISLTVIDYR
jgi:hypothetical protein